MKINKKGFTLVPVLVVLALLIIGGAWYFGKWKSGVPNNNSSGDTSKNVDWESLRLEMANIILARQTYPAGEPRLGDPVSIASTSDITGDGIPEALVAIPWGGGAASWQVAIFRLANNRPVLAQYKDDNGKILDAILLDAGSAGYANGTILDSQNKAIVYTSYGQNNDGSYNPRYSGGYATCKIDVYVWNPTTQIFEWNSVLNSKLHSQYCEKATPQNTP